MVNTCSYMRYLCCHNAPLNATKALAASPSPPLLLATNSYCFSWTRFAACLTVQRDKCTLSTRGKTVNAPPPEREYLSLGLLIWIRLLNGEAGEKEKAVSRISPRAEMRGQKNSAVLSSYAHKNPTASPFPLALKQSLCMYSASSLSFQQWL